MQADALKSVDFIADDGSFFPGLVAVRNNRATLPVDEQAAVKEAETFNRVDYVFFRRFSDGRSSHVAAYVVDNSDQNLSENDLALLHNQLWLYGKAPLLYVAWPARVDILSCARGPDFWDERSQERHYRPFSSKLNDTVQIHDELKRFSAFHLADGTLWEDASQKGIADSEKVAHVALVQGVIDADKELQGHRIPELRELLLLVVLIKYLEDRRVFPEPGWFGRWHRGAKSFLDVLNGGMPGEVLKLLGFLEDKFNGDIFCLSESTKNALTQKNLLAFADLVEAKTIKRQKYLWEQFSFEHLPVEIISHLYQHFVSGGHGAVYTPPFLAALLLDVVMPYGHFSEETRVLDPACGSGVFLVGAFRRVVNQWKSQHNWSKPDVQTLKSLLKRNIFGMDLDENAVNLAVFSLSLAICDALKPEVIWKDLRFDKLRGKNLLHGDFFAEVIRLQRGEKSLLEDGFDVVVGNPPFESELTEPAEEVESRTKREHKDRGKLPDNQAAYLFLEQATSLLRKKGRSCLIQPASLLHNRGTEPFRRHFLRMNEVKTVLDFTSIRGLFEADVKVVAILSAQTSEIPNGYSVSHLTFRRTASVQNRIFFELDHYDRHQIPQQVALDDPFVWRANLLGGGRLVSLSQRLRRTLTLKQFLSQQVGWDYGEGFIAGKEGRRTSAPFLTGLPYLPSKALDEDGIDVTKIGRVEEESFRSAYKIERYSPPLLLIRAGERLSVGFWDDGPLAYRAKLVGIHAPKKDVARLKKLFVFLTERNDLLRFCCALNGTQSLVGKSTAILKQDIDLLPYPEDPCEIALSFWEEALKDDILSSMLDFVRLGQNSRLLLESTEIDDLHKYADLFVKLLGSVYRNIHAGKAILGKMLICQPFFFGKPKVDLQLLEEDEDALQKLVFTEDRHAALRTNRLVRIYDNNAILVVKPNRLRYWIPSTAIRDADETLTDLHSWGY